MEFDWHNAWLFWCFALAGLSGLILVRDMATNELGVDSFVHYLVVVANTFLIGGLS